MGRSARARSSVSAGSSSSTSTRRTSPPRGPAVVRSGRPVLVTTEHNVWERYHRATYWANAVTFPRNDHVFAVSEEVRDVDPLPEGLRRFRRTPPLETLHHGIDLDRVRGDAARDGRAARSSGSRPTPRSSGPSRTSSRTRGTSTCCRWPRTSRASARTSGSSSWATARCRSEMLREARQPRDRRTRWCSQGSARMRSRVMRTFDVFAMSSVHEGLPLALLEAMALGCPPVATRVGGVTAVIEDDVNGFIVEPRDPAAQAELILRLLDDAWAPPAARGRRRERGGRVRRSRRRPADRGRSTRSWPHERRRARAGTDLADPALPTSDEAGGARAPPRARSAGVRRGSDHPSTSAGSTSRTRSGGRT